MVTQVSVEYEVRFAIVVVDTLYCSCKLQLLLLLLFCCLSPSGLAGPLPIEGNILLGSLGYRSNPQGALLQAEWLRAEGEVGAIWPDSVWRRGTSTTERHPR